MTTDTTNSGAAATDNAPCAHCGRLPGDPEYCDWQECPAGPLSASATQAPAAGDVRIAELTATLRHRNDSAHREREKLMAYIRKLETALWKMGDAGVAALDAARQLTKPAPEARVREAFEAWCPYKGAPDPWRVWQDAWAAALATVPSPAAAKESDPLDMPLPCDVTIGGGTLHKGVRLRALVLRAQGLHRMLMEHMPKPDPQAVAQIQALLKRGPVALDAAQQDSAQVAGKDGVE